LVELPDIQPLLAKLRENSITLRRPNPWDQPALRNFIEKHFSVGWANETSVAFANKPISCYVALHDDQIVGFGAYECTRRDYFGPTGVAAPYRKRGIGTALLLACLYGLQDMGYAYAIIGGAGPVEFYRKAVGAMEIPLREGKGIYGLREEPRFMKAERK
jgi:GNAT superfamily N-acetyltransferase